jgi:hypothetical protein
MKQTAVEFLVELLNNLNDDFNLAFKDEIEQALKIENQQIIDADVNGSFRTAEALDCKISLFGVKELAQQYYEETFNKG